MSDQRLIDTRSYRREAEQELHVPHSSDNKSDTATYRRDKSAMSNKLIAALAFAALTMAGIIWGRMNGDVGHNINRLDGHDAKLNEHDVRIKDMETRQSAQADLLREVRDDVKTLLRKAVAP